MLAEIKTGIEATKIAYDMAKAMKDIDSLSKINEAVIDIQRQLLAAQEGLMAAQRAEAELRDTISEQERRISELTTWNENRERFEMVEAGSGRFMAPKILGQDEVPYWLCIGCFDKGVRSVMQGTEMTGKGYERYWSCPSCGAKSALHFRDGPQRKRVA